jgi:hypothetical protein
MKRFAGPWRYLRLMAVIAWECLRHPFCVSVIDTRTGRVVRRY